MQASYEDRLQMLDDQLKAMQMQIEAMKTAEETKMERPR